MMVWTGSLQQAKLDFLVIEAQCGNNRAFALLYKYHNAALLRFAFRLSSDEQLACDSVQEAWITLSKTLRTLKDPRSFKAWAYKTVRWRVVDQVRRRGPATQELDVACEAAAVGAWMAETATSGQLSAQIKRLPDAEGECIHLFYLEDLSVAEIAHIQGVPAGTVKSRLNRARARLRQQFEGDD